MHTQFARNVLSAISVSVVLQSVCASSPPSPDDLERAENFEALSHNVLPEAGYVSSNPTVLPRTTPTRHRVGPNSTLSSSSQWPSLWPFNQLIPSRLLGNWSPLPNLLGVDVHFESPGRKCIYKGQTYIFASALHSFLELWPRRPPSRIAAARDSYRLHHHDFDNVVAMSFEGGPDLEAHDQGHYLWLLAECAARYIGMMYLDRGCVSSTVILDAKWTDRIPSTRLGVLTLEIKEPPEYDHSHRWPSLSSSRYPLKAPVEGEVAHPGTYLEFMDNDTAHVLWNIGLWTDPDPIRRSWVVRMLITVVRAIEHMDPVNMHGDFNIDEFTAQARYVAFRAEVFQHEIAPERAKWTKELAIRIFTTLWHLVHQNGVIGTVIRVYKEGVLLGAIALYSLGPDRGYFRRLG